MLSDSLAEGVLGITRAGRATSPLEERVAQLFVELRGDVFRYLITLGLHPPQAQEATQEVFLRLYETLKRSDNIDNPKAWIFRVAHNYGLKVRAREACEQPYDPEIALRLADPQVNPEMSAIQRERALRFHRAVESLSEQQRRCLLLRLEGLRYGEIGAVLGISASAVGEFLRRAVARLKTFSDE
jgi:RNA polymerase sigma-70 factor (ECF subfamily)